MTRTTQNPRVGLAAAAAILFLWSGWLVASRSGAQSALTLYDITAIRYGVSMLVALPYVILRKPWRGMAPLRILALSTFAGVPYALLIYGGFTFAPAAHGGVFVNGILPALTLALGWAWLGDRPRPLQLAGSALIVGAAVLALGDSGSAAGPDAWKGDLMFVGSACFFSVYMVLNRRWSVTIPQVLMCVAVVNGLVYVPIWWLALPSALAEVGQSQLLLQLFYQGLIPNLVGLALIALAVRHIGPTITAAFMSGVPAVGAILALVFLGEVLGPFGWASIAILTPGIVLTALRDTGRAGEKARAGG